MVAVVEVEGMHGRAGCPQSYSCVQFACSRSSNAAPWPLYAGSSSEGVGVSDCSRKRLLSGGSCEERVGRVKRELYEGLWID